MYQHTQIGWMTVVGLAVGFVILLGTYFEMGADMPGSQTVLAATVLMAVLIPVFGWLTVTVEQETVTAGFGIGLIWRRIRIKDIQAAMQVRNKWWYGWGIRAIRDGWMFNVSGLDAVELELKNGRKFRMGTDEPEELLNAIKVRSPKFEVRR